MIVPIKETRLSDDLASFAKTFDRWAEKGRFLTREEAAAFAGACTTMQRKADRLEEIACLQHAIELARKTVAETEAAVVDLRVFEEAIQADPKVVIFPGVRREHGA